MLLAMARPIFSWQISVVQVWASISTLVGILTSQLTLRTEAQICLSGWDDQECPNSLWRLIWVSLHSLNPGYWIKILRVQISNISITSTSRNREVVFPLFIAPSQHLCGAWHMVGAWKISGINECAPVKRVPGSPTPSVRVKEIPSRW